VAVKAVMLFTERDGVKERVGVGEIKESVWNELEPTVEAVLLG
jgi:hypothetical protein